MKYTFAIDETGSFNFDAHDKSFVCGVLISNTENTLKQKYQQIFKQFFPDKEVPNNAEGLIGSGVFHYKDLASEQKEICKNNLLPFAEKIFVSTGKPLLFANNQNYWQVAVSAVITKLFKEQVFQKEDKLNILIDFRAGKVWGTIAEGQPEFLKYHNILKQQFEKIIQNYRVSLGIEINIKFVSDTKSFFVNLADIVCGIVRNDESISTIKCSCERVFSGEDPVTLVKTNKIAALAVIFQEVLNNKFGNIGLIKDILKNSRNNEEQYNQLWDLFFNFLKYQIKQRYTTENFAKIKEIVALFLAEFKTHYTKIAAEKQLELATAFTEYISHRGEIAEPLSKEFVEQLFNENAETRATRKWEKWISYHLRTTQIQFNSYHFDEARTELETLWDKQEKMIKAIGFAEKDEQTTAIVGSLAQSYAFVGYIDEAIDYFKESSKFAIKSSSKSQSYSYLLTCFFIKQDVENVRVYFEKQTSKNPEEFINQKEKDIWSLLSYTKLRALELHINKKTDLPEILPDNKHTTYPHPLVLKWLSVALYLEDATANQEKIKEYLTQGIKELLKGTNGFTLKTLALPLIQIFALVDNNNPYHAQYNILVAALERECATFKLYTDENTILNNIKNDTDVWQKATALPFNYS